MTMYLKYKNFYSLYHQNKFNKIIHLIGIPAIVWSTFILTHHFKIKNIKLSSLVFLYYFNTYFIFNKKIILKFFILYYSLYVHSINFYKNNKKKSLKISVYVQIISWLAQILGHKYFEKNNPAFIKNLITSFTLAPAFVIDN